MVQVRRDDSKRRAWSERLAPQEQFQEASQGLFTARLGVVGSLLLTSRLPLHPTGLPRLIPALITHGIA